MSNKRQKITISLDEIDRLKENLGLFYFRNAEFSTLFVIQIVILNEHRIYNSNSIVDEIKSLEGISNKTMTKEPSQFKKEPLKGLWHKHHFQASFMLKNIGNYWGIDNRDQPRLSKMIDRLIQENDSVYFTDKLAAKIANEFTIGAYKDRASNKQITGEWIVFAKHENKNFYLSLANHREGDDAIYKRILSSCSDEFPFLFKIKKV